MKFKLLIFLSCICCCSFSQTKNEKETRIKPFEFPEACLNTLKVLPKSVKRLKFYKETDGNKQSFEAKFKNEKRYYSIEFNTNCKLEDIEVIVKQHQINETVWRKIDGYFTNKFSKTNFVKIQKQYIDTSNGSEFITIVLNNPETLASNYEIIAEVKEGNQRSVHEFTFNPQGEFIASRALKPSSYEHILY